MLDTPDQITKKFKRAVTDSEACVRYAEQDGINNPDGHLRLHHRQKLRRNQAGIRRPAAGDFKTAVGEAVVGELAPIQARYNEFVKDKAYLEKCYSEAAPRAEAIARRTLQKAMLGYLPPIR